MNETSNKVDVTTDVVQLTDLDHGSSRPMLQSSEKIVNLAEKVKARVDKYEKEGSKDPYKTKDDIGFFALTWRFASGTDKLIFFGAIFAICLYGSSRPFFSLMFGQVSGNVSSSQHQKEHKTWEAPVRMIVVGSLAGVFRFI